MAGQIPLNPRDPAQLRKAMWEASKKDSTLEAEVDAIQADYVSSTSPFGTDERLIKSDGTLRKVEATSIDPANVVQASVAFGTDDVLTASDGTSKNIKATTIDKDNVVQAAANFGAADQLIVSSGTARNLQSVAIVSDNLVTADTAFGTDNLVLISDGTQKGTEASSTTIFDNGGMQLSPSAVHEGPTFGSELLTAAGWTSTGWTGDFDAGFTHTVGNTNALSNTLAAVAGNLYLISWTVTNRTAGTFTVTFGGQTTTSAVSATGTFGPLASTTGALSFTPTSTFDGTISAISCKQITGVSTAVFSTLDTDIDTDPEFEIRITDRSLFNTAIGLSAGGNLVSGTNNFCIGGNAGLDLTTGSSNTFLGSNAGTNTSHTSQNAYIGSDSGRFATGQQNTVIGSSAASGTSFTGSFNTIIGRTAGLALTTGGINVFVGLSAGSSITTGNTNTFIGRNAGNNASQLVSATNSIGLGDSSFTTASNQCVIGPSTISQTILRGTVDVERGTTACRLNVYNTAAADPPGTSFELVAMRWDSNVAKIGTHKGSGGGTARDLALETDSTVRTQIGSTGIVASGSCYKPAYGVETYAAGTAYTLTATPAALDFGTTDPVIVLAQAGVYNVSGWIVFEYIGATFAANQTATFTLRRTNNTAADLTNGSTVFTTQIVTTLTGTAGIIYWEASDYTTANTDDSLTIFGSISATPSVGSVTTSAAFIKAKRIS